MSVQAHVSLAYPSGRSILIPGKKTPIMAVTVLPVAIVGMSAGASLAKLSLLFALLWLTMLPLAIYKRWAAYALPIVAASLLALTVLALPFDSAAFMVDYWTSALWLMMSWPRR
jgi:hypothetical protein